MRLHKEGRGTILASLCVVVIVVSLTFALRASFTVKALELILLGFFFLLLLHFFRNPRRPLTNPDNRMVYAPADGTIALVEQVKEPEYFGDDRMQISIFMSPLNVHVNRYAVGGTVSYKKYHPGKYLVAWLPKSSLLNERCSTVIKTTEGVEILLKQIAGAVARRIVCYAEKGAKAAQGDDLGFIKFGSRVDVLLPLNSKILVNKDQIVKGNVTIIAELKQN